MPQGLDRFFNARSLAIIGASADPRKLGGRAVVQNLQLGFSGALHLVNPAGGEIQGRPVHASVDDLPDGLDCAVVILPLKHVEAAAEACFRKKVGVLVVLSSGYAEHSPEGRVAQERLAARAREAGVRLVGPNSMGGLSLVNRMSATFTTVAEHEGRGWPHLGRVSIVSQSGFVGSHLMAKLRDRGVGLAHWIATGNQADVDIADCVAWLADDPATQTVALYLEGIGRADAFRDALERMRANGKAVVALKAGTTQAGAKAVASHTASLVGANEAFEAAFRHHGVLAAQTIEDLVDLTSALDTGRAPGARTLGVATVSGGLGILIADEAARNGLTLPELSEEAQQALKQGRDLTTALNPVDIGNMEQMDEAFGALMREGFGATLAAIGHFGLLARSTARFVDQLAAHRDAHPDAFLGVVADLSVEHRAAIHAQGIFTCEDPARAVRAIAALRQRAEEMQRPARAEPLPTLPSIDAALFGGPDDERKGRRLLRAAGVRVIQDVLAKTAEEAVAAARSFAGPVALKISSPDILHKSDMGGVKLNVDADHAGSAFDAIMASARRQAPEAHVDGVLVSPMAPAGVELVLGVVNDPVFGPLVMVGLGGIFVEVMGDRAVRLAPFGKETALEMLRELRGHALLTGARRTAPADLDAVADAIARISVLAHVHADRIESLEINPLVALPDGAVALDALIIGKLGR